MRLAILCTPLVLLSIASCYSYTAPPSTGDLDGNWTWFCGCPSGAEIDFSLTTSGRNVTGTGDICGVGPNCNPGPVTVKGEHVPGFGAFRLAFLNAGSLVATYSGQFVGQSQLEGTWTEATGSSIITFNRVIGAAVSPDQHVQRAGNHHL